MAFSDFLRIFNMLALMGPRYDVRMCETKHKMKFDSYVCKWLKQSESVISGELQQSKSMFSRCLLIKLSTNHVTAKFQRDIALKMAKIEKKVKGLALLQLFKNLSNSIVNKI